jgi:type IV secretion system protein VirD4
LEWRGPILALSVKSDLVDATAKHRSRGGKVWVYDPTGSSVAVADSWSPISSCTTWAHAMRMSAWMTEAAQPRSDSLSDGDYWYSQARKALAPYLYAAARGDKGVVDLVRWIDTQERTEVEDILRAHADDPDTSHTRWDELFDHGVVVARDLLDKRGPDGAKLAALPVEQWPDWLIREVTDAVETEWRLELSQQGTVGVDQLAPLAAARALWAKEPRLRGSVFATVENVLSTWADPSVGAAATTSEIDLTKWLAGNNTLYVVATAHEQARLRPVLTVLVQQAIRQAYDTAAANRGRLPHPCLLLLDEAGNTAPLRDLPAYAATARSHGISLVTVWQDLAQVKALYNDRAQTVLNNHRAKLFGAGIADAETLDYVSRLVGDEAHSERNLSVDLHGGRRSVSQHQSYRRAAPMDVLRRIRPGEGVLLYGSELPAHVRLRTWFDDRGLRRTADRPDLVPSRRSRARLRR